MISFKNSKIRFGALILAIAMTFAQLPISAFTVDAEVASGIAGGVITDFDQLASPYTMVSSGNYNVTVPMGVASEKLPLPKELAAMVIVEEDVASSGSNSGVPSSVQVKVPVAWVSSEYDPQKEGAYLFTSTLPNTYTLAQDVRLVNIYVNVIQPAYASVSSSGPVVTDQATYDVFMNVDPTAGMDIKELKDLVSQKLDTLIDSDPATFSQTHRILTSQTTVDTTDLRYWYVYDHYDLAAWPDSTPTTSGKTWSDAYSQYSMYGDSGRQRPYQAVVEGASYMGAGMPTTIKYLLDNNLSLNYANQLAEHIYAGSDDQGAFMIFDGYGYNNIGGNDYTDFLFYPTTSKGVKKVNFTVDASEVEPHSLESAGFLCNVGVNESDPNGTISGYIVAFGYKNGDNPNPSNQIKADSYNYIRLYKIKEDVSAFDFSNFAGSYSELKIAMYADQVGADVTLPPFYAQTDIQLSIDETSISLEMRKSADDSTPYTEVADWGITPTGYQGFGPYVAYEDSGHSCQYISAFRFSNLKMSIQQDIATDSLLAAIDNADYLVEGENRYFVNLIGTKDYAFVGSENDKDKAYINQMQEGKIKLITDKTSTNAPAEEIFPEHYLGDNAQDVNTDVVRDDALFLSIFDPLNTSEIDTKAAEIAWLIYKNNWNGDSGTVANPTETAVGKLILMDSASTNPDTPWADANQINVIQKELMGEDKLKVYLNSDESKNADGLAKEYTITKPDGIMLKLVNIASKSNELELLYDSTRNNKPYFVVDKTWAQGTYTVGLVLKPAGAITQSIPAATKFTISIDNVKPSVAKPVITTRNNKVTANFDFINTPSQEVNTYTSALKYYAVVINDSGTAPVTVTDKIEISQETPLPKSYTEPSVVKRTVGTYYAHVFVWDEAGNMGVNTESFSVEGPKITDVNVGKNANGNPNISFKPTGITYELASYRIKTEKGTDTTYTKMPEDGKAIHDILGGKYKITIIVVDVAGNSAQQEISVDVKTVQTFRDDAHKVGDDFVYNLEAGKDTNVVLAMVNSSDFKQVDERPNPPVEFVLPAVDPQVITLTNGVMTPKKLGTVVVTAKAAETASHYAAQQDITIHVITPLAVNLLVDNYDSVGSKGISLIPSHSLGAYALNTTTSPATLRYREAEAREWITISGWNWDKSTQLLFADLKPSTKYEVEVSATDTRPNTPTVATKMISFRTPNTKTVGSGEVKVGVTNLKANKVVNITMQVGSTVLDGTTLRGSDINPMVSHTFTNLQDGVYNVVFEHEGKIVTDVVEIKNGLALKEVIIPFAALSDRETIVTHENDLASPTVIGGLNNLYANDTLASEANKGITKADIDAIETQVDGAKGSGMIELKVKGVLETDAANETDVKEAIDKIKKKAEGQSIAVLTDFSLWKTITPARAVSSVTTQLIEANSLIEIIMPLPVIRGTNIRMYRVHDADGAERSEAAALAEQIPMGVANANAFGEYFELDKDHVTLHVRLFSLYAITFDPPQENEDNNPADEFWKVVKDEIDSVKNEDVIYADAKNYDKMPASVMDKLIQNPNVTLVIKVDDKTNITIPAGKAVMPDANRIYYPFSLLQELYNEVTFVNPQTGGGSYFTTQEGKVIPATGALVQVDAHATSSNLSNKAVNEDQANGAGSSRLNFILVAIMSMAGLGYWLVLWYKKRKIN